MTDFFSKLGTTQRAAVVLAATFAAGMGARELLGQQHDLPERVSVLEDQQVIVNYLFCRSVADDEGRDPYACRTMLPEDVLRRIRILLNNGHGGRVDLP